MSFRRDFALALFVIVVILAALGCTSRPEITNTVKLTDTQLRRFDCAAVYPSQVWLDDLAKIPRRLEAAPESIKDVTILLVEDDYRLTVFMFWRAENKFGGMSKREIHNGGPLHVDGDCTFTLKDDRGWKTS